jgi:hypothetical protein
LRKYFEKRVKKKKKKKKKKMGLKFIEARELEPKIMRSLLISLAGGARFDALLSLGNRFVLGGGAVGGI